MNEGAIARATRRYKIRVFDGGQCVFNEVGQFYIYFNDKDGSFHFEDEHGKHHRIYGGVVIVDEI